MNEQLSITTLGHLEITHNGEPLPPLASRKADALLIYLVATQKSHARELLATMLWDERTTSRSLGNLSVLLTSLRKQLGSFLVADRNSVAIAPAREVWLDALIMEKRLNEVQAEREENEGLSEAIVDKMEQALTLYEGAFLDGFHIRNGRGFEEWALLERERYQRMAIHSHHTLIGYYLASGKYTVGLTHATVLLQLDPLSEEAHRLKMQLLARNGERQKALEQFELCRHLLKNELGVEPHPTTLSLFSRIKNIGQATIKLPHPPTPFVGRKSELAQISNRLINPDCRLLTLLGAGGTGKTRLAIKAALENKLAFLNGVVFIPLEALESEALLVPAFATALNFSFFGKQPPQEQLLNYLEEKEFLLVIDNFEHFLNTASFLSEILQYAPKVKILVTSRVRLKLRGEWVLEVTGLEVPAPKAENVALSDAVQLFVQSARRVKSSFALTAVNTPEVAHICRLVDGSPLALELAASWVRLLTPAEIGSEISRNLDFLEASLSDVPARHYSLRAVFEHSWHQLTDQEQEVFQRLSVFRGGFDREAATAVADASLSIIATLIDKSLLQSDGRRYQIHTLLRQYATEALSQNDSIFRITQRQHSRYFGTFLESYEQLLNGPKQKSASETLGTEIDNIRTGWQIAVDTIDVETIERYLKGMWLLYNLRSWNQEGAQTYSLATQKLRSIPNPNAQTEIVLAKTLARQAKCHELLSEAEIAESLYRECIQLVKRHHVDDEEAFALYGLGFVKLMKSQYEEARSYLEESLQIYQRLGHQTGMGNVFNTLCQVARRQGHYVQSRTFGENGLSIRRDLGDLRGIASSLNVLGMVALALDNFTDAKRQLEESLEISREIGYPIMIANILSNLAHAVYFLEEKEHSITLTQESLDIYWQIGDQWGVAIGMNNLGYIASEMGKDAEAKSWYRDSLKINRKIDNKWGIVNNLGNLGQTCMVLEAYVEAGHYLQEALQMSTTINAPQMVVETIVRIGTLCIKTGKHRRGLILLGFSQKHPALRAPEKERLKMALFEGEARLSESEVQEALAIGTSFGYDEKGIAKAIALAQLD